MRGCLLSQGGHPSSTGVPVLVEVPSSAAVPNVLAATAGGCSAMPRVVVCGARSYTRLLSRLLVDSTACYSRQAHHASLICREMAFHGHRPCGRARHRWPGVETTSNRVRRHPRELRRWIHDSVKQDGRPSPTVRVRMAQRQARMTWLQPGLPTSYSWAQIGGRSEALWPLSPCACAQRRGRRS